MENRCAPFVVRFMLSFLGGRRVSQNLVATVGLNRSATTMIYFSSCYYILIPFIWMAGLLIEGSSQQLGIIEGRLQFSDKTPFNETTRITLNHGEFSTYSRLDGTFAIRNVPPGIHVLDIQSTVYHFSQIKIQFLPDEMSNPRCIEYLYPGAKKNAVPHPLTLTALATYSYFEPRRGFSIFDLLKNPMIIMMAFSAGLMFLMPKMMEGLDPEEKERMKQQMEMQKDPTKLLSQLWGDLSGTAQQPESTVVRKKDKTK